MTSDRGDAHRDAAALIRATADRDGEAVNIVLDYSDNRQVCAVLALIVVTACRAYGETFLGDLCAELRSLDRQEDTPA